MKYTALVLGLILAAGGTQVARAGFDSSFTSNVSGQTFTYTLNTSHSVQHFESGDFMTIYDFGPASNIVAPAGWSATQALLGQTPSVIPTDDPGVLNLTLTYSGDPFVGDVTFSADTTSTGHTFQLNNAADRTHNTVGPQSELHTVWVPDLAAGSGVPEPASLGLLAAGFTALAFRRRKA